MEELEKIIEEKNIHSKELIQEYKDLLYLIDNIDDQRIRNDLKMKIHKAPKKLILEAALSAIQKQLRNILAKSNLKNGVTI